MVYLVARAYYENNKRRLENCSFRFAFDPFSVTARASYTVQVLTHSGCCSFSLDKSCANNRWNSRCARISICYNINEQDTIKKGVKESRCPHSCSVNKAGFILRGLRASRRCFWSHTRDSRVVFGRVLPVPNRIDNQSTRILSIADTSFDYQRSLIFV